MFYRVLGTVWVVVVEWWQTLGLSSERAVGGEKNQGRWQSRFVLNGWVSMLQQLQKVTHLERASGIAHPKRVSPCDALTGL